MREWDVWNEGKEEFKCNIVCQLRENLSEDETFPKRDLAHYLAAKVYYNLEEF